MPTAFYVWWWRSRRSWCRCSWTLHVSRRPNPCQATKSLKSLNLGHFFATFQFGMYAAQKTGCFGSPIQSAAPQMQSNEEDRFITQQQFMSVRPRLTGCPSAESAPEGCCATSNTMEPDATSNTPHLIRWNQAWLDNRQSWATFEGAKTILK